MKITDKDMRLYAITDNQWLGTHSLAEQVEAVLANGATFLQLRDKQADHAALTAQAIVLKKIASKYGVPFVVNDDVWAAKEADADGVHIGQNDTDYEQARKILGDNKIIGMTAKTVEQAVRAEQMGADYIGVGAVFHTTTKADAKDMSKETLLAITEQVHIPVVAIGGIGYDNADYLRYTGVSGIAVVSAIFAQPDAGAAAKRLSDKTKTLFNYAPHNIIFDMDGTLLDSMPYWHRLGREYVLSKGIAVPPDFDKVIYSMDLNECSAYFHDELGINEEPGKIKQTVLDIIRRHYDQDIPMKPGMKRLVTREYRNQSRMCIFTSSEKSCVTGAMKRLGLLDYFEQIYTSYDINISKRSPESYLTICKMMGFEPEKTIVYEDVCHGVKAAKAAGCYVTAVYDEDSAGQWEEISSIADDTIHL